MYLVKPDLVTHTCNPMRGRLRQDSCQEHKNQPRLHRVAGHTTLHTTTTKDNLSRTPKNDIIFISLAMPFLLFDYVNCTYHLYCFISISQIYTDAPRHVLLNEAALDHTLLGQVFCLSVFFFFSVTGFLDEVIAVLDLTR